MYIPLFSIIIKYQIVKIHFFFHQLLNNNFSFLCFYLILILIFAFILAYSLCMDYAGIYSLTSEEMVWSKDFMLREQFILPLCTIFTAVMMIYVRGGEVGLWEAVVCGILSRQIFYFLIFPLDVYYAILNGQSDPAYSLFHTPSGTLKATKMFWSYVLFVFLHLVVSFIEITSLAAMVK